MLAFHTNRQIYVKLFMSFSFSITEALFSLGPEELGSLEDNNKPDAKVFRSFNYCLLEFDLRGNNTSAASGKYVFCKKSRVSLANILFYALI